MAVNRMFGRSQRRRLAAALSAEGDLPATSPAEPARDPLESPPSRGDLLPVAQRQLAALVPTQIASLLGCFLAIVLLIGLAVVTECSREIFNRELIPDSERFATSLQHVRSGLRLQGQGTFAGWLTQLFLLLAAATLCVAGAALLLPLRGVHARIRQAKAAELEWVEAQILERRHALKAAASHEAPGSLADLVAYRDLVQEAPEWPIGSSSYARFALYLLIPVLSWAAAALVERFVNALIS